MKLRRGCGCPILLLGIFNLLMVVASILSLARGSKSAVVGSGATKWGTVLFLLVFAGDVAVCAIIGLASLRGGMEDQVTGDREGTEDADEGTDSPEP